MSKCRNPCCRVVAVMTNPLMMIDLFDAWMLTVLVGKVIVSELIAGFSQAEELRVTEPGLAVITCDNPAVGVSFFAYNSLLQGNAPACRVLVLQGVPSKETACFAPLAPWS